MRVLVKELDIEGRVYEHQEEGYPPHEQIYGIRLEKVAYKGYPPSEVWHCKAEGLAPTG